MNIFVGNLLFETTEEDVRRAFEAFGNVASVAIVMEKKGDKSRGFGFVEMPDDQKAQAAITALNGKEFMGRVLNVEPARPKVKKEPEFQRQHRGERPQKNSRFNPTFKRTGRYREGRRTLSFMKKRAAAGIAEQVSPKPKTLENPMRWRKKQRTPKPWQKAEGESRPWKKPEGEPRPWKKFEGASKPWKKSEGNKRKMQSGFRSRKKTD